MEGKTAVRNSLEKIYGAAGADKKKLRFLEGGEMTELEETIESLTADVLGSIAELKKKSFEEGMQAALMKQPSAEPFAEETDSDSVAKLAREVSELKETLEKREEAEAERKREEITERMDSLEKALRETSVPDLNARLALVSEKMRELDKTMESAKLFEDDLLSFRHEFENKLSEKLDALASLEEKISSIDSRIEQKISERTLDFSLLEQKIAEQLAALQAAEASVTELKETLSGIDARFAAVMEAASKDAAKEVQKALKKERKKTAKTDAALKKRVRLLEKKTVSKKRVARTVAQLRKRIAENALLKKRIRAVGEKAASKRVVGEVAEKISSLKKRVASAKTAKPAAKKKK